MSEFLCGCGTRLQNKGIDNGCMRLVCPNKKCGMEYRLPVGELPMSPCYLIRTRDTIIKEAELTPVPITIAAVPVQAKAYTCRKCSAGISEEQALKTFKEHERALCAGCAA